VAEPTCAYLALVQKIERVVGHVPVGTKDLLNVLTHPDVIDLTWAFMEEKYAADSREEGAS
jgi:hypothetical protein